MKLSYPLSDKPSMTDYLHAIISAPIYNVVQVTPLQAMKKLSARLGNQISVKREDYQSVHSFKIRGAYNMLAGLNLKPSSAGVITASAGNHAQGVALSARELNLKATIVMPKTTPDIKVDAVRQLKGNVILYGSNFDEAKNHAIALAKQSGAIFIPAFDHPAVIAGQGTIALELIQQNAQLDRIFIPVGGGGLAAGIAVLMKQIMPSVKLIGVEAQESACLQAALMHGEPIDLTTVGLFADGVAVKRIGDETFRLCQRYLDDVIIVNSDEICAAVKDLFDDVRAIAEPSGALALAGLKKYVEQKAIQGEHLLHILSGANLNFHGLRYISERCELGERREALFAVTIPEQKGSFLNFCRLLGPRTMTEFNYRYGNERNASIFVGIRLTYADERYQIIQQLTTEGYQVVDLSDDEMAKLHVRYMVGGRPAKLLNERLISFEFPERPGALLQFLEAVGNNCNISLFHYRSHGTDFGRVLAAFDNESFDDNLMLQLQQLGYPSQDETNNPAFHFFLT